MNRREFLFQAGTVVIVLPAGVMWACDGASAGSKGPTVWTFRSSTEMAHSHTVALELTLLDEPPPEGATKDTSDANGHTHVITLTSEELTTIRSGGEVSRTTSTVEAHSHTFALKRSAATNPGGGDYEKPGGY